MKLTTATEYDHQANDCVQCVWHQSEDGWTKAAAVAAAPWRAYIKVNHTIGRTVLLNKIQNEQIESPAGAYFEHTN